MALSFHIWRRPSFHPFDPLIFSSQLIRPTYLSAAMLLIRAFSRILGSILRRSLGLSWSKSPKPNTSPRCLSHPSADFGSASLKIFTTSGLFCSIAKLTAFRSFLGHSRNLNWLSLTKSKAGLDRLSNFSISVDVVRFSYRFCIAGMSSRYVTSQL